MPIIRQKNSDIRPKKSGVNRYIIVYPYGKFKFAFIGPFIGQVVPFLERFEAVFPSRMEPENGR